MTLSHWEILVDVVSKVFREMVKVAQKPENAAPPVIGPIFHSSAWRMDVHNDASWRAFLNEVRQQEHTRRAVRCLSTAGTEKGGFRQRKHTARLRL